MCPPRCDKAKRKVALQFVLAACNGHNLIVENDKRCADGGIGFKRKFASCLTSQKTRQPIGIFANQLGIGELQDFPLAIEMAHGVFQAGLTGERVSFPLVKRAHPLAA